MLPACFAGVMQLHHVALSDAARCLSCRGRADPAAVLTPGPCRPQFQRRVRVNAGAVLTPWPHRRRAERKSDTRGGWMPSRGFCENSSCKWRRARAQGVSGLVAEYVVAIDVSRDRFPAEAFHARRSAVQNSHVVDGRWHAKPPVRRSFCGCQVFAGTAGGLKASLAWLAVRPRRLSEQRRAMRLAAGFSVSKSPLPSPESVPSLPASTSEPNGVREREREREGERASERERARKREREGGIERAREREREHRERYI